MSQGSVHDNPFADPIPRPPGHPFVPPPKKNGRVLMIGMLAIVMGALGFVGVLATAVGYASGAALAAAAPGPNADAMERLQYQIQVEQAAVMQRYLPGNIVFSTLHVIVAILLIVGGVRVIRMSPPGRSFLVYVFLAVIIFELLRTGMYMMMQLELMPIMDELMVRTMREAAGGGPNEHAARLMARMWKGMSIAGIVMGLIWPTIKVVLYGLSARYLASEEALGLFEEAAAQRQASAT